MSTLNSSFVTHKQSDESVTVEIMLAFSLPNKRFSMHVSFVA